MLHILNANALHLPLADNTVQACITSPPYWGLRDYGTAKWTGGDPACDHQVGNQVNQTKDKHSSRDHIFSTGVRPGADTRVCRLCGATREDNQLGLELTPDCLGWATGQPCGVCYVCHMVAVFREVGRVLRPDGTLWLNLGDSYAGSWGNYGARNGNQRSRISERYHRPAYEDRQNGWSGLPPTANVQGLKPKDLVGIPWRVALALQADGWYLRSDVIWHKPNPMPESVTDRPTKSHEYFFLLSKSEQYYYDAEAVKEENAPGSVPTGSKINKGSKVRIGQGNTSKTSIFTPGNMTREEIQEKYYTNGRNRRSVWTVATKPYSGAHFATFPPALVEVPVLASTSPKACPHCRAPWERVINKHVEPHPNRWSKTNDAMQFNAEENTYKNGGNLGVAVVSETTGWQPTCACAENDGSGKCLVLDPFSGTATVGRVCLEKGRAYVGTELNRAYIALAEKRTSGVQVELL